MGVLFPRKVRKLSKKFLDNFFIIRASSSFCTCMFVHKNLLFLLFLSHLGLNSALAKILRCESGSMHGHAGCRTKVCKQQMILKRSIAPTSLFLSRYKSYDLHHLKTALPRTIMLRSILC